MKQSKIANAILLIITVLGIAASARILWKRSAYERANNTVEIVIDLPSLMALAPPDKPIGPILDKLAKRGVRTFGVYEVKAKKKLEYGELVDSHGALDKGAMAPGITLRRNPEFNDKRLDAWKLYLETYFGSGTCGRDGDTCVVPDVGHRIDDISFGLTAPPGVDKVLPRFFNTPFENKESIALKLATLDELETPGVIIFDGDSVLGYPTLIEHTAAEINVRDGWSFGMIEITKQDGAHALARKLPGRVLPVHSIPGDELAKLPRPKAVARFRRAVRERGIRVIYVRPYTTLYGLSAKEALERNLEYINDIADSIEKDGFRLGDARPIAPFLVSRPMRALCLAGAVALVALLAASVVGLPAWPGVVAVLGAFALGAFLPDSSGALSLGLFIKLVALGTACFIPAFAVAKYFIPTRAPGGQPESLGLAATAVKWIATCALTLTGAAMVAAMLSQRSYFLRLDVFSGVKLSFLLPIVILVIIYLRRTGVDFADFFSTPVRYVEIVAGSALLLAMALYIVRSGNESPAAVSGIEENLRAFLEMVFVARPRTKEFLIGHPALLLAGLFPAARGRYFPLLVLIAGIIGQVSIFNTFCHLHSPILTSWLRTCFGVSLGFVVGACARFGVSVALGGLRRLKGTF